MKIKKFLNDYFSFTKKESAGIISLVILIILAFTLPSLFSLFTQPKTQPVDEEFVTAIKSLKVDTANSKSMNDYFDNYNSADKSKRIFALTPHMFDPNTLSEAGWIEMGIRPKTAATIRKYISKGGKFKSPEDLRKIYGLSADVVEKLIPYVAISSGKINETNSGTQYPPNTNKPFVYAPRTIQPVKINAADTSEFIALPGIGSKLAQRIITFRDKLGGFYSVDQVGETFLLPDSTFQKIKTFLLLDAGPLRKLNINTATMEELKAHPYIRYNIANAIIQYRQQHGNFQNVSDVKKVVLINDEIYSKLSSYLKVE